MKTRNPSKTMYILNRQVREIFTRLEADGKAQFLYATRTGKTVYYVFLLRDEAVDWTDQKMTADKLIALYG